MNSINELNISIKEKVDNYKGFSSEQLKLAALMFMILDHLGYKLGDDGDLLRAIGRLSFPIFAFLISEGFRHTSNRNKYLIRMFIFALISEIPFNLLLNDSVFYADRQNVMFTYALGLIMLMAIETIRIRIVDFSLEALAEGGAVMLTCAASGIIQTDYYVVGIIMIWIFYRWADDYICEIVLLIILFLMQLELTGILSIILILRYNGKLSNGLRSHGQAVLIKYLFYIAYPLHMLLLAVLI